MKNGEQTLENSIASMIAGEIKTRTGKGPANTEVFLHNHYLLVKVSGYLLPYEKELSRAGQGYFDVKFNRARWVHTNIEALMEKMSALIGRIIKEFYYDVNPETDCSITVWFFE
ncbi:Na-translocating system protein MpsC family protein [Phosphitispora fastidiosa]|uniref:Na-translocating system protein MpsC family protein n=1 Tax=Phosphitispora fastidiosa TaxID=2837202 RepID=UPI001E45E5E6|nr:Na-translocating system protein MpsC family protein [Phosphitispora fastidiosa]MBU7006258.1 putative protein YbcI [Phosphitispora fastidiosa]